MKALSHTLQALSLRTSSPSRRKILGLGMSLGLPSRASQASQFLTVAAYPAIDQIVKDAIPAWNALHPNVAIKVISRQFGDHHTAMSTALSTSAYLPDVIALEVGFLGRFAQGGGLEDLSGPAYDFGRQEKRFVPYAVDQAKNRAGKLMAVPADLGPGTLLYRRDLLERANTQEADLTRSWDDFVSAGTQIKRKTGAYLLAHARDIKDIIIRTNLRANEGLYFSNSSEVLVNSPRFARAFALAQRVRKEKLDAGVTAWSNDWTESFRRGSLACQLSGAWLAGHLNNWLAPATKGLWRAAALPEGAAAAFGGSFYAIPRLASATNKALAWDFIRLLAMDSRQQLNAFRTQDAFPSLLEAHNDSFFEQPIAFLGGQKARILWRESARQISAVPVHKQDAFADEVINSELDQVLIRGKSIPKALGDAHRLLEKRAYR